MKTAVVVGNPKAKSRTLEAGCLVARKLTDTEPDLIVNLVDFGPALLEWGNAAVTQSLEAVRHMDVMIVASPTFRQPTPDC